MIFRGEVFASSCIEVANELVSKFAKESSSIGEYPKSYVEISEIVKAEAYGKELSEIMADDFKISVLSTDEASELFVKLASRKEIPFNCPDSGCYARAHKMAELAEQMGIIVGKIFVIGDLSIVTPNHPNGFVKWNGHMAPIISVKNESGISAMVIDPSMFNEIVPVETWVKAQTGTRREIYLTTRYNYQGPMETNVHWVDDDFSDMDETLDYFLKIQKDRAAHPIQNQYKNAREYYEQQFKDRMQQDNPEVDVGKIAIRLEASELFYGHKFYTLLDGDKEVGGGRFGMFPDDTYTLDFHLSMHKKYRGHGASYFFLATALEQFPNTQRIPGGLGRDNLKAFIKNSTGTIEKMHKLSFEKVQNLTNQERIDLSEKLIEAAKATPFYHMANKLGFGHLERVIVDPVNKRVFLDIRKGPPSEKEVSRVYLRYFEKGKPFWSYSRKNKKWSPNNNQYSSWQMTKDGELLQVDNKESLINEIYEDWFPIRGYIR